MEKVKINPYRIIVQTIGQNTVPVRIEDVKPSEEMVRCTYFSIECDTPQPGWEMEIPYGRLPFLMNGLSGIITSAIDGAHFIKPQIIDKTISAIEEIPGMYFDTNSVFVPFFSFKREPKRGSIFRIRADIFASILMFTRDQDDKYRGKLSNLQHDGFKPSPEETKAFSEWTASIIEHSRKIHAEKPENRRLQTISKENRGW